MDHHELLLDLAKVPTDAELPLIRSPAEILALIPCFNGLHKVQIRRILKLCTVGSYRPGEKVCLIDAPSDEMYILISGELGVSKKDGSQVLTISPVTMVGVLGFMTNCPRTVALEAITDSKVLSISRARFDRLFEHDPDIQTKVHRNINDVLSSALIRLRGLVEEALDRNPGQ